MDFFAIIIIIIIIWSKQKGPKPIFFHFVNPADKRRNCSKFNSVSSRWAKTETLSQFVVPELPAVVPHLCH